VPICVALSRRNMFSISPKTCRAGPASRPGIPKWQSGPGRVAGPKFSAVRFLPENAGVLRAHRATPSLLYSDVMILCPRCPIFRDDEGNLLDQPRKLPSSPCCPKCGAMANHRPDELQPYRRVPSAVRVCAAPRRPTDTRGGAGRVGVAYSQRSRGSRRAFVSHLRALGGTIRAGRISRCWDIPASLETFEEFRAAVGQNGFQATWRARTK